MEVMEDILPVGEKNIWLEPSKSTFWWLKTCLMQDALRFKLEFKAFVHKEQFKEFANDKPSLEKPFQCSECNKVIINVPSEGSWRGGGWYCQGDRGGKGEKTLKISTYTFIPRKCWTFFNGL